MENDGEYGVEQKGKTPADIVRHVQRQRHRNRRMKRD